MNTNQKVSERWNIGGKSSELIDFDVPVDDSEENNDSIDSFSDDADCLFCKDGGPGSGNHGHEGRSGEIGGSAPAGSNVGGEKHKPISERSTPAVKSKKSFDKYVNDNGLKRIYRGFSAQTEDEQKNFSESIKNGTAPDSGSGSSALGTGIYFSDKESEAKDYMVRRQNETGGKFGQVETCALDVDAKVADSIEISRKKLQAESDAVQKAFSLMRSDAPKGQVEDAIQYAQSFAGMDVSTFAKQQGYDAIYDVGTGYTVVVNQKALVVCENSDSANTDTSENTEDNQEKTLDISPENNTIKLRDTSTDGAPKGNQNAAGPHKKKGSGGYKVSKEQREKITKRLVGQKSSKGTEVKAVSDHAFDRVGQRMISPGRIEKMLASTDTKPDKTHPDRTVYDIEGSRLVLSDDGTVVSVMWRKKKG